MGMKITQAVIAAGGFGTRLKPFTDTAPKPMIPVLGKPLLEWNIEQFKRHGVTNFVFTLHHRPSVITNYFGDGSHFGVDIRYYLEEQPLGSGGALKHVAELEDRFFYMYGDMLSLVDYSKMRNAYAEKVAPIGMQRTEKSDQYADADIVELDAAGRFVSIRKKPHTQVYKDAYRMRGIFILEREILEYLPEGPADLAKDLLPRVAEAGMNFYGYECDDFSKGIDTLEKLREVESELQKRGFA